MKTLLTSALLVVTGASVAQLPPLTWSSEVTVADGGMYGNINPSITLTAGNVPVVMWGHNDGRLFVSRWTGSGFSTPVRITPMGMSVFSSDWAAPNIVASGNNVYAAFKQEPEMMEPIYFVKSTDGGLTWGDTMRIADNWSRFASVAVRPDGNPVVVYMEFDSGFVNPRQVVKYSADGGNSFGPAMDATAIAPGDVCDCCQAFNLSDGTRDVVVYRNNNSNMRDIWVSKTDDNGASFAEVDIDESNWMLGSCPGAGPGAMLTADSVIATWMSGATGPGRVYVGTLSLNDMQPGFNLMRSGVSGSPNQDNPALAGNADTIGLFWEEVAGGNRDVFMSYSVSGVAGLNDTVINVSNTAGSQLDIEGAYAGGVFYVVYMNNVSGDVHYSTASLPTVSGVEPRGEERVSVFPNPAIDIIHVDAKNLLRISILDLSGRTMITSSSDVIDVSQLPGGVYFVKAETSGGVAVRKVAMQ